MEDNAAASGSSCELANPAQMRQIASQTGVLLRQMRFVAGRGAVAELLLAGLGRKAGLAGKLAGPESWPNRLECDIDAYAVAHALAVIDIGAGKAGQVAVIGRSVLGYLVVEGLHPRGVESELLAYLV